MQIDGIYYGEHEWTFRRDLWAYRLYPNGTLLFACIGRLGVVLKTAAGESVKLCSQDVLENRTLFDEFCRAFSKEHETALKFRSGLRVVEQARYRFDEGKLSFFHQFFGMTQIAVSGEYSPERLVLDLEAEPLQKTTERKVQRHLRLIYSRLI